jgi:hypothetical protein
MISKYFVLGIVKSASAVCTLVPLTFRIKYDIKAAIIIPILIKLRVLLSVS